MIDKSPSNDRQHRNKSSIETAYKMSSHQDSDIVPDTEMTGEVTLRIVGPAIINVETIPLVDWTIGQIVFWTWDNIPYIQNVYINESIGQSDHSQFQRACVAHVSAKSPGTPCTSCKEGPATFTECRINAYWPSQVACTSCASEGKEDSCSLNRGRYYCSSQSP